MEYLYGKHTVLTFLESKPQTEILSCVQEIYLSQKIDKSFQKKLEDFLASKKIRFYSRKQLDQLFPNANHQGIVLKYKIIESKQKKDWQSYVKENGGPLLLLDSIQDVNNLANITRSAEALGVRALFTTGKGVSFQDRLHRISSGASFYLPMFHLSNLHQLILHLKKMNFWICSSVDPSSSKEKIKTNALYIEHKDTNHLPLSENIALVMGNESKGIHSLILSLSDYILTISLKGKTPSLNVGSASAILIDRIINGSS